MVSRGVGGGVAGDRQEAYVVGGELDHASWAD